jgi:6-pyruvoyltetrahydropterin/6-carboxytetrahydropterin synthase
MKATVRREAHFNAAHRLFRKEWSDTKNEEIYGKCANPYYHGHNYRLIVEVTGDIDPTTGYVVDMKVLKSLINNEIEEKFDHKNLNEQCPEFFDLVPTAENIAATIWRILKEKLNKNYHLNIILYETDRNSVSCSGN